MISREAVWNNEGSEIAILFLRLEPIRDPAAGFREERVTVYCRKQSPAAATFIHNLLDL